jgi:hypothetical protein
MPPAAKKTVTKILKILILKCNCKLMIISKGKGMKAVRHGPKTLDLSGILLSIVSGALFPGTNNLIAIRPK